MIVYPVFLGTPARRPNIKRLTPRDASLMNSAAYSSEAEGTRTPNHRIDSPVL
jgi:hypothetical protein